MIVIAVLASIFVLSGPFETKTWIVGDIAYHRGVAFTMMGGDWQGSGPYAGLLTYSGGLYPMGLALLSSVTGAEPDLVLSIASWVGPVVWTLSLLALGFRLWSRQILGVGVFTILGTIAMPFTLNLQSLWVESTLPSGHAFWPVFPRDLGLIIMIWMWWAAASSRSSTRVVAWGILFGVGIAVHAQIALVGFLTAAGVGLWLAARDSRARRFGFRELPMAAALGMALSVWWWLPRLQAAARSDLLLQSHPLRTPFQPSLVDLIAAFGIVGVLAALGLLAAAGKTRDHPRYGAFLVALVALLPFLLAARIGGDLGIVTERRLWLVAAIPLIGLATEAALWLTEVVPGVIALPVLILVLLAAPIAGLRSSVDLLDETWNDPVFQGRTVDRSVWDPMFEDLRELTSHGPVTVLTYDAFASMIWSWSGTHVVGAWLPGSMKLGFDPDTETGFGQAERTRAVLDGFGGGVASICRVAATYGADAVLLERQNGLVGTYDLSAGAPYRIDLAERTVDSLAVPIGDGVVYRDRNKWDELILDTGGRFAIEEWTSRSVRALRFEVRVGQPGEFAEVRVGDSTAVLASPESGDQEVWLPVTGLETPVAVTALSPFRLRRVTAFEPVSGLGSGAEELILAQVVELCG